MGKTHKRKSKVAEPALEPETKKLILYHFTAVEFLPSIATHGVVKGDLPLAPDVGLLAPCLTSSAKAGDQLWAIRGDVPINKLMIRIAYAFDPENLPYALWHYPRIFKALEGRSDVWEAVQELGGNPEHWWVHLSPLPFNQQSVHEVAMQQPGGLYIAQAWNNINMFLKKHGVERNPAPPKEDSNKTVKPSEVATPAPPPIILVGRKEQLG